MTVEWRCNRLAGYNACMGANSAAETDAWLRGGGLVVASSDRAARDIASNYHRARQAEGLAAWPAPSVVDWQSFVRSNWNTRSADGRLLPSAAQELSLWTNILEESGSSATLLPGPRRRLASMAMDAHNLLCSYAPRFLRASTRAGWQQDAAEFHKWLQSFDEACRKGSLVSQSLVPLELIPLLEADQSQRAPVLLVGFDRLLPLQTSVLNAWGAWSEVTLEKSAADVRSFAATDNQYELAACAQWCNYQLRSNPKKKLLIIATDGPDRRGSIERALLRSLPTSDLPSFEFSLGVPLGQVPLARSAFLLLRWVTRSLEEHELDWLFSNSYTAANPDENAALQACMRALRHRGLERSDWSLNGFARQRIGSKGAPLAWVKRMRDSQQLLELQSRGTRSPLDWAALVPKILETARWPGYRPLLSPEYQTAVRWQQALDTCGSLGFDGRSIDWSTFLSEFEGILSETLFALESQGAPILIAGPAESAGLTADAIWFLGANEDAWPSRGSMHPLLPVDVQREAGMPHATTQLDWELARSMSTRILASAPEVRFSYALQNNGVEARPSRLIVLLAGQAVPVPSELAPEPSHVPLAIAVEDASRIPLPIDLFVAASDAVVRDVANNEGGQAPERLRGVRGGSNVLTSQSQCPFKAFATARLAAQGWQPAENGLTASLRGRLLHAVLHAIWGGPPAGIASLDELRSLPDRRSFVTDHVQTVLRNEMPPGASERLPQRYLLLEERRLTRLVTEWLEYELTRQPFDVLATEAEHETSIAGLPLRLRLDRIDRLNDGSLLVIDYKTGDVSPKSWELPRPDDVQLPLYAGFALGPEQTLGGLTFAKVRAGDHCFDGRVGDARATLLGNLSSQSQLIREPLSAEQVMAWRDAIQQLARDFVSGRADVDPREYPENCKRCGLQTLCRIEEHREGAADEDGSNNVEADSD